MRRRRPGRVYIMALCEQVEEHQIGFSLSFFSSLVCLFLRRHLISQSQSQTVRKTGDEVKCMMNEIFILKLQLFL